MKRLMKIVQRVQDIWSGKKNSRVNHMTLKCDLDSA